MDRFAEEYDYYEEFEESEEDDELVRLPKVVEIELQFRKGLNSPTDLPPNKEAVQALREHFASGLAQPFVCGGFITLMNELGATPRSDDMLVKDTEHNIWYIAGLSDTSISKDEEIARKIEQHQSEVRLLRYGEFIEQQQAKGNVLGPHCAFLEHQDSWTYDVWKSHCAAHTEGAGTYDCDLTTEQLMAVSQGFSLGFWSYANHDRVYAGAAHGVEAKQTNKGSNPEGLRLLNIEVSVRDIIQQCEELEERYDTQHCPLGPTEIFEPQRVHMTSGKKKGRQNKNKPNQQVSHAECVADHMHALVSTLDAHCSQSSSAAMARILGAISSMLCAAVMADIDVARSLATREGETIIRLREHSLKCAKEADADESRFDWACDDWWNPFSKLNTLLGRIIMGLADAESRNVLGADISTPDAELAASFYDNTAKPALLKSIESSLATERKSAIAALHSVTAVSRQYAYALVKDKDTWSTLVSATKCFKVERLPSESRSEKRERLMSPDTAVDATHFLTALCARGMVVDESPTAKSPVAPCSIARKMIQRGIVPLFMELARSSVEQVSAEAMHGLAHISRVKDCRTIMFQDSRSIELVRDMMISSHGEKVSHTMLVVSHLMWDEEWWEPLISIDPPIEAIATKWATFCMQSIRKHADDRKNEHQQERDVRMEMTKRMYARNASPEEKERLAIELKQLKERMAKAPTWREIETEQCRGEIASVTLNRSMLLLSTLCHHENTLDRLLSADVLALAAACIDIPMEDAQTTAATLLSNMVGVLGTDCFPPGLFPDPDHILRSIISCINKMADEKEENQHRTFVFIQILTAMRRETKWAPYFDALAEKDEEARFTIESMLPMLMSSRAFGDASSGGRARVLKQRRDVHEKCTELSGKLRTCRACGKIEGKRGDLKSCKRCHVTKYCNRDCQLSDWPRHKRECKTIAASASSKSEK